MYNWFNEKEDPLMIGLSPALLLMLDKARAFAEVPFIITSGVRTLAEEIKLGGVENSAHLYGLACDLRCHDSISRYKMLYGLYMAGFKRIGIDSKHIHVDIDDTKAHNVFWLE